MDTSTKEYLSVCLNGIEVLTDLLRILEQRVKALENKSPVDEKE